MEKYRPVFVWRDQNLSSYPRERTSSSRTLHTTNQGEKWISMQKHTLPKYQAGEQKRKKKFKMITFHRQWSHHRWEYCYSILQHWYPSDPQLVWRQISLEKLGFSLHLYQKINQIPYHKTSFSHQTKNPSIELIQKWRIHIKSRQKLQDREREREKTSAGASSKLGTAIFKTNIGILSRDPFCILQLAAFHDCNPRSKNDSATIFEEQSIPITQRPTMNQKKKLPVTSRSWPWMPEIDMETQTETLILRNVIIISR